MKGETVVYKSASKNDCYKLLLVKLEEKIKAKQIVREWRHASVLRHSKSYIYIRYGRNKLPQTGQLKCCVMSEM